MEKKFSDMDIGVVTSFYNGYDRFTPRWAESICEQLVKPRLVVMIASGPVESIRNIAISKSMLEKAGIPYIFKQLPTHKIMGFARNEAVRNCNTEWVMYLDADDTMVPTALRDIQKYAEDTDVICTGLKIMGDRKHKTLIYKSASTEKQLAGGHVSCSHSPYRRKFWEIAPYIETTEYCDQALWLGFAQAGARFKGTEEVCTIYHTRKNGHNLSMTNKQWLEYWNQKKKFMEEGVPRTDGKIGKIRTHYFNPTKGAGKNNFGDMLVPTILKWLTNEYVTWVPATEEGKILCIGSELNSGVLMENDIVFGYGAKKELMIDLPSGVKVLALRGPKTRQLIKQDIGEVPYGDPAILMPKIYTPKIKKMHYKLGIIPHYVDKAKFDIKDKTFKVININANAFDVIDNIYNCDFIVSTSLHGAIVAEAYGKKVVWLKVSDNVGGMEFKWNDYIMGTGREEAKPVEIMKNKIISKDLYYLKDKCLPKPIDNSEKLIQAWRDYYDNL